MWVHLVLSAESVIVGDGYQHPSVDEGDFFSSRYVAFAKPCVKERRWVVRLEILSLS